MFGLDVLISVANVIYLFSYSVRDILWLRILTVVGALLLLPYYYLQPVPLWAAIAWNLVFIAINVFWIAKLLSERRPVQLSDDEKRLYRLALRNLNPRDALNLVAQTFCREHNPPDPRTVIVDFDLSELAEDQGIRRYIGVPVWRDEYRQVRANSYAKFLVFLWSAKRIQ